ncbi:MAG: ribonuclease III [Armatimonadota bacterium]|nr:ribonuclease III [Armatimonadota bacterium]MDR7422587.1 ribonuclease III [Armatimonadota bacterium]MDR7453592.1 ribonuclease III [Armatimonadota bacterium]MDR7456928.1 ribonuclease III [Armatimonadota bacterium]MDR7496766.1 ribonuclease III [Armatimonadota bacterium]
MGRARRRAPRPPVEVSGDETGAVGEVLSQDRLAQLAQLEERLGVRFRDRSLLDLALRHGSFSHERGHDPGKSYERLELLGDAVLSLVVSDDLYRRYPDMDEGGLAKQRARVVNEAALASVARRLDLGRYILLGRGEEKGGGRQRQSLLADAVESVIGAVYIDSGYGVAHHVVSRWIHELGEVIQRAGEDFKSQLQERLQRRRQMPRYRITQEEGPDHARTFLAVVEVNGRPLGEGRGKSKKEAEQAAAAEALSRLERGGA